MKSCLEPGCKNPPFNEYCRYHQYRLYMKGGRLHKRKAPVARRTKKRDKDERQYKNQARGFFDEAVKNGTNICVFCGKKVTIYEGLHHLKGRTNDYLLDRVWWRTVHNKCHVEDYHQASYGQISEQPWYNDFLLRIKEASEELWRKEIRKGEKAPHKLNPKIWDDNEDIF
jgi:hypothetical protein